MRRFGRVHRDSAVKTRLPAYGVSWVSGLGESMGQRKQQPRGSRFAGLRRAMAADQPESVIRDWDGRSKGFGTQSLYATIAIAVTSLLATIAVVVFGFEAAVATIAVGAGVLLVVTWLAPPARTTKTPVTKIQIGDFVATALDNDFVITAAPVVAITTARRGALALVQVATASGAAYETEETGHLPVAALIGFRPARPRSFAADPASADGAGTWAWTPLVAEILGRLLPNQRDGHSAPTRDQVRSDLVMRVGCTPATARYALQAATGLGLVTPANKITATPAGAVWFACRYNRAGSRIDAPAALMTSSEHMSATVSVRDESVRLPGTVADVSDRATAARFSPMRKR